MSDKPIIVGKVSGVHGVRGWIKIFSWTQPRENIANYNPLLLEQKDGWKAISVKAARAQGRTIVASLEGIDDRDLAATLIGKQLAIKPSQLPQLKEGWYWSQLIGLTVVTETGDMLGEVTSMQETAANDVLVLGESDDALLVPFVTGPIVKKVDLDAGHIVVDWDPEYL